MVKTKLDIIDSFTGKLINQINEFVVKKENREKVIEF
jgi:hypothetical protein